MLLHGLFACCDESSSWVQVDTAHHPDKWFPRLFHCSDGAGVPRGWQTSSVHPSPPRRASPVFHVAMVASKSASPISPGTFVAVSFLIPRGLVTNQKLPLSSSTLNWAHLKVLSMVVICSSSAFGGSIDGDGCTTRQLSRIIIQHYVFQPTTMPLASTNLTLFCLTSKVLHAPASAQTNFYTHQPAFTQTLFYTKHFLQKPTFTPTSFYTNRLLHKLAFSQTTF